MYPDQKLATDIPRSGKSFTVQDYKIELGKPYSKLDLYICCKSEFPRSDDDVGLHHDKSSEKGQVSVPFVLLKDEAVDPMYSDMIADTDIMFPTL